MTRILTTNHLSSSLSLYSTLYTYTYTHTYTYTYTYTYQYRYSIWRREVTLFFWATYCGLSHCISTSRPGLLVVLLVPLVVVVVTIVVVEAMLTYWRVCRHVGR